MGLDLDPEGVWIDRHLAPGEVIHWSLGYKLMVARPTLLTGVVIPQRTPATPARIGVSEEEWRRYLTYHRQSRETLDRAYEQLREGWEVMGNLMKLCEPERAEDEQCEEIPCIFETPLPNGLKLCQVKSIQGKVLGRKKDFPPSFLEQ